MVDLEQLAHRARRAAEWSRARMAARVVVAVVALATVAIIAGGGVVPCACLATLLFVAAALLRWWGRDGIDAVRLGLMTGTVPLLAAALLPTVGVACAPSDHVAEAELLCAIAGAAAGVGLAVLADRARHRWRSWLLATGVAALTTTLGCLSLGASVLGVTLAALAASSIAVRVSIVARAR